MAQAAMARSNETMALKSDAADGRPAATMPAGWMAGPGMPHGGMLEAAAKRFPDAPRPFLDLSTGINPVPYEMPELPLAASTRLPHTAPPPPLPPSPPP